MRRFAIVPFGFSILVSICSGCGESAPEASPPPGAPVEAGPNRRFKIKEEYKQALDKDGHLILKPGMKKPDLSPKPKS